jgi:PPK2 family polyphosphate:nucleotide phosphotransferase
MTTTYRISDGRGFRLADWDPGDTGAFAGGKAEARAEVAQLAARLGELQNLLYADGRHRVLVVLQGMDTAGKSGAIRRLAQDMNPASVRVTSFKAPTEVELAHDFLWRVHPHVPANGQIAVFDRSHYEDVLIVRVHDLVPEKRWAARYAHIRAFEQMLADEGTTICKFFLHISEEEQRRRLQARVDDPTKRWKFHKDDLDERRSWSAYQKAYQEVIRRTSTEAAPWHIVPADRKWHRDVVVCRALVAALEGIDLRYPSGEDGLAGVVVD